MLRIPFGSWWFSRRRVGLAILALSLTASRAFAASDSVHCTHDLPFNAGPNQRPRLLDGIGKTHFPITSSNPEVQQWFDQGNTLLHCFWYYEAERAFRWCIKLDPDCAMAYWGLARAISADSTGSDRDEQAASLMKEAIGRADKTSERERLYIQAWAALWDRKIGDHYSMLEQLCLKYSADIEAKCLIARENLGKENRYGNDAILREVLAVAPDHVGAHHYRIHTWDGGDGASRTALGSCAALQRIAPNAAHAQHMPGHIYSGLGMWHEAAISMDIAARTEARYLRTNMVMPFDEWSYAHNRNYLSYVQEQLGMAKAAIEGADELLSIPRDPDRNSDENKHSVVNNGKLALARVLVKFELWSEILKPGRIPWGKTVTDRMWRSYCEALALMGSGKFKESSGRIAEHAALARDIDKFPNDDEIRSIYSIQQRELDARLRLLRGERRAPLRLLEEAARRELDLRAAHRDPPQYPICLYTILGRALLANGDPAGAETAFRKTLKAIPNDLFALAGLVETCTALNDVDGARNSLSSLLFVASDADAGLLWLDRVKSMVHGAPAIDSSSSHQRLYHSVVLEGFGPRGWEPAPAPPLHAQDGTGGQVTLADHQGKNVLLIFGSPGRDSLCDKQMTEFAARATAFAKLNTEIILLTADSLAAKKVRSAYPSPPFRLLFDPECKNARLYGAYDEFQDVCLDATVLIDTGGRIRWARRGGAPFQNIGFLLSEIHRANSSVTTATAHGKPDEHGG